ncbi:MAG: hypothetical protein SynsKO_15690 [Synoicihabitans sp.]
MKLSSLSWGLVFAAIWTPVLWRMSAAWRVDEELVHGWIVPLLVLHLAFERWREGLPLIATPNRRAKYLLGLSLVGLWAGILIWEANPLWPRIMWFTTGTAVLVSLGMLARAGGWKWARFWAGYLLLLFIALPWPTMVQRPITLGLSAFNAHIAAEVVSAMGHPAAVHGQIIEVAAGVVGVEEACSGIRSLQTVTMAGIFLGVLFRLGWKMGFGLVALGWVVAMVGNLIRTCFLVHVLAAQGHGQMEAVHDAAGSLVLVVTLLVLGAVAWKLPRPASPSTPSEAISARSAHLSRLSWVGLVIMIFVAEFSVFAWYAPASLKPDRLYWDWADRPEGRAVQVPEYAQKMLDYSEGGGWSWLDGQTGYRSLAYRFYWNEPVLRKGAATVHDPTVCLPNSGTVLERELQPLSVESGAGEITLNAYRFVTTRGQVQYVFFQVWDAFAEAEVPPGSAEVDRIQSRWQRVAERRRGTDLYQLFLVIEGPDQDEAALKFASEWLPRIFIGRRS